MLSFDEITELYALNDDLVTTSVEVPREDHSIEVYPNPFENFIRVQGEDGSEYKIMALDGKLIKQGTLIGESIDLIDLTAGVYFLSVSSKSFTTNVKLIKE